MAYKESQVENHLHEQVKKRGGFTRKTVYQGRKGAPDRQCFFPGGRLLIVETKRYGQKPDDQQLEELKKLRAIGQFVAWTDSREGVDKLLEVFFYCNNIEVFNKEFPLL